MSEEIHSVELYKSWYKTRDNRSGFLSIVGWIGKPRGDNDGPSLQLSIDIGSIVEGKSHSTKCFVNAEDLALFTQTVVRYPELAKSIYGLKSVFESYGGSAKDGSVVSRVLKIEELDSGGEFPSYLWKCGHFEGQKAPTGAIKPLNTKNPISRNEIKRSPLEMTKISYILDNVLKAFYANQFTNLVTG